MNIFGVLGDIIEAGAKAVGAGAKTLTEVEDNFSNNLRFKLEKLPVVMTIYMRHTVSLLKVIPK